MSLNNAVSTTDNCRYCLMCRHVCPVGHVTRLETLTPHGWGLLISSVHRGLLTWTDPLTHFFRAQPVMIQGDGRVSFVGE